MRFLPDRYEMLALVGVWLLWPALFFSRNATMVVLAQFCGSLPLTMRFGIEVLQWNRWGVPSLVGTAVVVAIARVVRDANRKKAACHVVTVAAFGFAVAELGLLFMN
jgi:hypothetical protein